MSPQPTPAESASPADGELIGEREGVLRELSELYVRHRRVLLAIAVGFLLISFNGQWIVERDTSLYRGLGHALATGQGYRFGEFASRVCYPGLPLILAGCELAFGESALPPIILINLMALATLAVTYRLVRLYFAEWIAVAVTVGVGMNARLQQATQEIMTDVPFLLGVVMFLYGWERLKLALAPSPGTPGEGGGEGRRRSRAGTASGENLEAGPHPSPLPEYRERGQGSLPCALSYLIPGVILTLSMRPTFWILAMAWGLVCLWGLWRGPRRFYGGCLIVVVVVALGWFVLDPRVRGFNPLGGGYERDFVATLGKAGLTLAGNLPELIGRQLTVSFFNGRFGVGLTHLAALALIGSTYFLFRRGLVLWGLLVLCTIGVTLLVQVVPRYYLMVLPCMMVGYVLLCRALAERAGPKWGPAVFTAGVVLLIVPNLVRGSKFVYEQHVRDPGRREEWNRSIVAAEMVKDFVPEGATVLAPGAPIVSYLSGRQAYMSREIFDEAGSPLAWPEQLAAKGVEYAVFPPVKIRDQEPIVAELMDRGVIVPTGVITRERGLTLATIRVDVPPPGHDWRTNPVTDLEWVTTTRRGPTSDQIRRQQRLRREANEARLRRERNELKAKMEAKRAREAREARERQANLAAKKAREARLHREAMARQAANRRRLQRLRQQQAATQQAATQPSATAQPATQPVPRVVPRVAPPTSQPVSMRLEGGLIVVISPFYPVISGV